jgi:hypothetical protein
VTHLHGVEFYSELVCMESPGHDLHLESVLMGVTSVGLSLSLNSEPGFTGKSSELILTFDFPVM